MSEAMSRTGDAEVIELRPEPSADTASAPPAGTSAGTRPEAASGEDRPRDTSYEVVLEEPAPAAGASGPPIVSASVEGAEGEVRPVIPPALRSRSGFAAAARRVVARWRHTVAYHAVRSPLYTVRVGVYAVAGLVRLGRRQVRWWWLAEQHQLRQAAAATGDAGLWLKLHREARHVRVWRGLTLAAELVALVEVVPAAWAATGGHRTRLAGHLPHVPHGRVWLVAAGLGGVVWLAHGGRPAGKKLGTGAGATSRDPTITADVILRAYYAAKLGDPDKPGQQIQFGSTMAADGDGSRVVIDLPYGKGLDDAIKARPAIASGLDVSLSQVF